jgi:hypothetical protein
MTHRGELGGASPREGAAGEQGVLAAGTRGCGLGVPGLALGIRLWVVPNLAVELGRLVACSTTRPV